MSSRTILIGIVVLFMIAAAFAYTRNTEPQPRLDDQPQLPAAQAPEKKTYSNPKYGLSFTYPARYQLTEYDAPGSALRNRHTIVLIREEDLPAPQNGEGPPSITIDMFQNNLDGQTTEGWIRGTSDSNFKLGEMRLSSTTIDGEQALSYRWSGLYEGTSIVVAKPEWVYAFSVTYMEPGADIVQDFVQVRDSVEFVAVSSE